MELHYILMKKRSFRFSENSGEETIFADPLEMYVNDSSQKMLSCSSQVIEGI